MFKDTKSIEYAIKIIKTLAANPGQYDSNSIIFMIQQRSEKDDLSVSYLKKVLQKLSRSGIVTSSNEGYMLSRPPAEILISSLLDILPQSVETDVKSLEEFIIKLLGRSNVQELWKD